MRYSPLLVKPMRADLTRIGFRELMTPEDVDAFMAERDGTALVVVNSVCGCAAGKARPGVALALRHGAAPERLATVFAGMELDATERARSYFEGYAPSSPQIALFKAGRLVHMLERRDVEGRSAEQIAENLRAAFDRFCTPAA